MINLPHTTMLGYRGMVTGIDRLVPRYSAKVSSRFVKALPPNNWLIA